MTSAAQPGAPGAARGRWLGHPAAWVLAALHVMLAGWALADDRFLNDEGLLSHLFAQLTARDFVPAFFLQKARPPLATLYAPVALLGLDVFLWVHVLLCSLAVPLVEATARQLGHRRPLVPAAVVALSPMFVAGSAAGLSNADAVLGVAGVLLLWSQGRLLAAGAVLGALVWVRAELMLLVLVMLAWSAVRRQWRAWIGLLLWPVLYGLAGLAYHQYLLWMTHYPPALPSPMPGSPFWATQPQAPSLAALVSAAVALCPAVVLAAGARHGRAPTDLERWWGWFAVAFVVALTVLPRWRVFNFDLSPRYLLPVLPVLALAIGRATQGWGARAGVAWRTSALLVAAALAIAAHRTGATLAAAWAVLGVAAAMALAGSGRPRAALALLLAGLAFGPRHFAEGARIGRAIQAPHLDEMVERIDAQGGTRPVFTNEPILAAYLTRRADRPQTQVHYLVQADQLHELTRLSNPANGQQSRLLAAAAHGFFGRPVFPADLDPDRLPPDALFVLRDDARLELVMPADVWSPRLSPLGGGHGRVRVAELREAPRVVPAADGVEEGSLP